MSNQQQLRQKEYYIQVAKDFLRLLEEKNIPALIDLWANDGINYYPYNSGMSPEKIAGKQSIYETCVDCKTGQSHGPLFCVERI